MIRISVVIITFNEERNIARCIDSVLPVADEIVVIDSYSTDRTRAICLDRGARFIEHAFEGFTAQKNFAMQQASFSHILSLDADEYLSPELLHSILNIKAGGNADGYSMNRLNNYGGKWIKSCGWYPDTKIRLWNKEKGDWQGGLIHETVVMKHGSSVSHLPGDLLHMAYCNPGDLISKIDQYATIYAREHAFKKKVSTPSILLKAIASFLKNYLLRGGIRDGYEGLLISTSNANGVFYKYARLLEANRALKTSLIITTYNRKDALEIVLLSVMNLTEPPDEIIIADDGSGADTRAVVESFQLRLKIPLKYCWHEDEGFRLAMIRNKAIAMAEHPYLIMIDGDMVMPPKFVSDHKAAAWRGRFIQGSRVMLNEKATAETIANRTATFGFFSRGILNRKNTLRGKLLSLIFSHYSGNIYRVRGANMSFWKEDLVRVNGFNEDFTGWGREDSEFVARMQNCGIRKFHLKFAGFAYHLYHPENSRDKLGHNQQIADETVSQRIKRTANGLDKYLHR